MEGQAKSAAYLTSIALKSAGRHPWHQVSLRWIHMSGILVVTMSMYCPEVQPGRRHVHEQHPYYPEVQTPLIVSQRDQRRACGAVTLQRCTILQQVSDYRGR